MKELKIFKNDLFEVGAKIEKDQVLLDVEQVAKSLGFTEIKGNKLYVRWRTINGYLKKHLSQDVAKGDLIPESLVYKLAFKASNEIAEQFQDWLAIEVIPSIRKHGAYMVDEVLERTINDPDYMIGLLTNLKHERQKRKALEVHNLMLEQQVAEAQPKVTYYDTILKSTKLVTVTQISKDYGLSAQKLNKLLHHQGIQYKQSKQWFLYSKYQNMGYTKSETIIDEYGEARMNTKWTQKGRLFIHQELHKLGIYPVMDRDNQAS